MMRSTETSSPTLQNPTTTLSDLRRHQILIGGKLPEQARSWRTLRFRSSMNCSYLGRAGRHVNSHTSPDTSRQLDEVGLLPRVLLLVPHGR